MIVVGPSFIKICGEEIIKKGSCFGSALDKEILENYYEIFGRKEEKETLLQSVWQ